MPPRPAAEKLAAAAAAAPAAISIQDLTVRFGEVLAVEVQRLVVEPVGLRGLAPVEPVAVRALQPGQLHERQGAQQGGSGGTLTAPGTRPGAKEPLDKL